MFAEEIKHLSEMFPDADENALLDVLRECDYDTEQAINKLLGSDENGSLEISFSCVRITITCDTCIQPRSKGLATKSIQVSLSQFSEPYTLEKQLGLYTKDVNEDVIKILQVNRQELWQRALIFYKATPKKDLYKRLSVTFEGYENAIDAGALRIEYFGDLIRHINNNLFEGKEMHRIPLHSWDKVHLLQMGGLMLAHSILQKGPGMPTLAPYVYEFICSGEKSKAVALITEDDLPNNPQNKDLSDFLKKVTCFCTLSFFL